MLTMEPVLKIQFQTELWCVAIFFIFCCTGLPLARTRWVRSTFSSHCSHSSNQRRWLTSASLIIFPLLALLLPTTFELRELLNVIKQTHCLINHHDWQEMKCDLTYNRKLNSFDWSLIRNYTRTLTRLLNSILVVDLEVLTMTKAWIWTHFQRYT